MLKIGDLVLRKSYSKDILFKIININNLFILSGMNYRLIADSPESDLISASKSEIDNITSSFQNQIAKENTRSSDNSVHGKEYSIPGKILHLDGASNYAVQCEKYYKFMKVNSVVIVVPEKLQALKVKPLLVEHNPEILVLTGHDGMKKNSQNPNNLSAYINSGNYICAVKEARKLIPSLDSLVIIAGACQSYFEALLDSGANFASSPGRILIDTFDPSRVAQKVAIAGIDRVLAVSEAILGVNKGLDCIGGMQTRGTQRIAAPRK